MGVCVVVGLIRNGRKGPNPHRHTDTATGIAYLPWRGQSRPAARGPPGPEECSRAVFFCRVCACSRKSLLVWLCGGDASHAR